VRVLELLSWETSLRLPETGLEAEATANPSKVLEWISSRAHAATCAARMKCAGVCREIYMTYHFIRAMATVLQ
jgi:predicted transcriptional regulator